MVPQREQNSFRPVSKPFQANYQRVEFVLNNSQHPIYQFKLWRSQGNCVFLLVKDNSELLPQLKVGCIMPMTYMSDSSSIKTAVHNTRISRIVDERQGRFQGHHRVELAIVASAQAVH
ncbi:MAG: hypothetical protein M0036_06340 [Desulfobacteraceae bacterium]|nr:hypothetical protein [Desulfobacteraceae bacterium]